MFYIIWGQTLGIKHLGSSPGHKGTSECCVCSQLCPCTPKNTPKQPKGGAGLGRAPNLPQIWVSPQRTETELDQRHHVLENPPQGWHGMAREAQLCQPCLAEGSWGKARDGMMLLQAPAKGSWALERSRESFSRCWTPAPAVEAMRGGTRADLGARGCISTDGSLSRGNLCVR